MNGVQGSLRFLPAVLQLLLSVLQPGDTVPVLFLGILQLLLRLGYLVIDLLGKRIVADLRTLPAEALQLGKNAFFRGSVFLGIEIEPGQCLAFHIGSCIAVIIIARVKCLRCHLHIVGSGAESCFTFSSRILQNRRRKGRFIDNCRDYEGIT